VTTLDWVESTQLSTAIREGALPYPVIGGVHLLAIALFGGMVLVSDLRLLGWLMPRRPVSQIIGPLRTWKRAGLVLVIGSGALLGWAEPHKLYGSPSFWIKMALLAGVGAHAAAFRGSVYGNLQRLDVRLTAPARLAALISLALWTGLVVTGRLIGFDL
jgi:uncharacterized protein DUF6644